MFLNSVEIASVQEYLNFLRFALLHLQILFTLQTEGKTLQQKDYDSMMTQMMISIF